MGIENYLIIAVLLAIAVAITIYLLKAKKRGDKCIGCPYSKQCHGNCDMNKKA